MLFSFGFGKKRRKSRSTKSRKGSRKPPASLIRACKRHRIKCTKKVGKRRVYKSISTLKKQLRRKKTIKRRKAHKRVKKNVRKSRRRSVRRRFRFGESAASAAPVQNYGYNNPVPQAAGVLSQSSQVVTADNNKNRPPGFELDGASVPTFGVYRPFFTENVPTTVGPSWNFMGQPDRSSYPVGGPFSRYTQFGKRRRGRKSRMYMY